MKRAPQQIATDLQAILQNETNPLVESSQVAGPFLNIFVHCLSAAKLLIPSAISGSLFDLSSYHSSSPSSKRIMVEFSQPNTHVATFSEIYTFAHFYTARKRGLYQPTSFF